eukprot:CAMPEP_0184019580 /NCGR_PEP_ID=MMETSP0954-20121128/8833_1 /TAXON_ID=627963 /ORGANISM="Aplanochytrium sp, Strain PBS07" /LENGTH=371 /DNA_ID=CAMNT_0026301267 /DNA_START=1441 /DNA_END=2553 /DNA_ORIENTATION=-
MISPENATSGEGDTLYENVSRSREALKTATKSKQSVKKLRSLYQAYLNDLENGVEDLENGKGGGVKSDGEASSDTDTTSDESESEDEYSMLETESKLSKLQTIKPEELSGDSDTVGVETESLLEKEVRSEREGLVAQIQNLRKQLHEVKSSSDIHSMQTFTGASPKLATWNSTPAREENIRHRNDVSRAPKVVGENAKIIACSVHNPVRMSRSAAGEGWVYQDTSNPFKEAITYLSTSNETVFVNWPGTEIDTHSQEGVRKKLFQDYNCVPVFLQNELSVPFYKGFCHSILWPIFHSMEGSVDYMKLPNLYEDQNAYISANQKFLDVVASLYNDGDIVIVYAYHLMLLPALLRRRFPEIKCCFFFNTPFPP